MAVTLVFNLKNVTPEVWNMMAKRLNDDDIRGTGVNEVSVWGYGEMSNYPPVNKESAKDARFQYGQAK